MIRKLTSNWLVALGCLVAVSMAMAAEPPPSGTVQLSSTAVAVGIGVSWGDGKLTVGGKTYPFWSKVSASPTSAFRRSRLRARSST